MAGWLTLSLFLCLLPAISGVTLLNRESFKAALDGKETLVIFFYRNVRDRGNNIVFTMDSVDHVWFD